MSNDDLIAVFEALLAKQCGKKLLHPNAIADIYVRVALKQSNGNVSRTARALGLERRTLQRMLYKNVDKRAGEQMRCPPGGCQLCVKSN